MLPTISKTFDRVLIGQLTKFSNKFLSPILCDFRKWYSTQYALVNMHSLMDLSEAYDCASHELIIAKLAAYGLNEGSLRLIQN